MRVSFQLEGVLDGDGRGDLGDLRVELLGPLALHDDEVGCGGSQRLEVDTSVGGPDVGGLSVELLTHHGRVVAGEWRHDCRDRVDAEGDDSLERAVAVEDRDAVRATHVGRTEGVRDGRGRGSPRRLRRRVGLGAARGDEADSQSCEKSECWAWAWDRREVHDQKVSLPLHLVVTAAEHISHPLGCEPARPILGRRRVHPA